MCIWYIDNLGIQKAEEEKLSFCGSFIHKFYHSINKTFNVHVVEGKNCYLIWRCTFIKEIYYTAKKLMKLLKVKNIFI